MGLRIVTRVGWVKEGHLFILTLSFSSELIVTFRRDVLLMELKCSIRSIEMDENHKGVSYWYLDLILMGGLQMIIRKFTGTFSCTTMTDLLQS